MFTDCIQCCNVKQHCALFIISGPRLQAADAAEARLKISAFS
jgi:hypothetical protein